ncbi:Kunitz/Bovine pancreatic trypsin inhibitor domain protein [Ancylostoma duodenale]|uniref:Kunitz/Bovine pancreatic trypsin inhibitor domain protein n=1 Tax=Ancylostoma duodenale TaxID=51022 RepID=A0A0C2G8G9_9BILA|nr:Kunitz/Bovine pancreatic trypsin inhibitor domain protein [Ancylostoma duodenale]
MYYDGHAATVLPNLLNGGIPTEVYNTAGGLPTEYFDVGIPDGSGTTSPRFYYDSREGRCIQFSYLGQGGNFNNFLSQDHCEKFCSRSKHCCNLLNLWVIINEKRNRIN